MAEKYLFIHIPKTAGVKIRHNLHMHADFPRGRVCVQEEACDLRLLTDAELQSFSLVSGHFGYAVRRRLEATRRTVTVLRDPVQRVISLYHYWRSLVGTPLAAMTLSESIYDFAVSENPVVVEHIDNAQAWQIFEDFLMPTRHRFAGISDEELLDRALENLSALDFVGIQEDMEGTLRGMRATFGWPWTDESAERRNATPEYSADELDLPRLRDRLATRLRLDERLYEAGRKLFESRRPE